MIFDDAGELVWFHPVVDKIVTDFKVGVFKGRPVLTWWEGKVVHGLADGEWVVLDASYRELFRLSAARGRHGDLHEFVITPAGHRPRDEQRDDDVGSAERRRQPGRAGRRRSRPGACSFRAAACSGSGAASTMWPSARRRSRQRPGPRFDYFHINSIDVAPDNDLIISGRNTWAAYKVSRHTGRVRWRLGGKRSDFTFGKNAGFEWQHDVREHAHGVVSVFDNAAAPQEEPQSRALLLALDTKRMHVSLEHAYTHQPDKVLSHFLGDAQLLANGDVFVGWGAAPYLTEFAQDGAIAFDARLPHGGQSYRAFRFPWVGRPADRPALAARGDKIYASWNGATEIASWQLLEGASAGDMRRTQAVPRAGFETPLALAAQTRSVAVVALDASGASLGTSETVRL